MLVMPLWKVIQFKVQHGINNRCGRWGYGRRKVGGNLGQKKPDRKAWRPQGTYLTRMGNWNGMERGVTSELMLLRFRKCTVTDGSRTKLSWRCLRIFSIQICGNASLRGAGIIQMQFTIWRRDL